jgi:hypothetical protein
MQTGVISSDTFSKVLRDFAGKRRQGILEIQSADRRFEIVFSQGKIIYADCVLETSPCGTTLLFLAAALKQRFGFHDAENCSDYKALFSLWLAQSTDEEHARWHFAFYLRHAVLETLYSTLDHQNGYFAFRHETISDELELLPSLSVGQILLDMVSLEAGEFEGIVAEDAMLSLSGEYLGTPSEEERVLLGILEKGPQNLKKLQAESGLSSFHFGSSILSLSERGILEERDLQDCHNDENDSSMHVQGGDRASHAEGDIVLTGDEEALTEEELSLAESVYVWNMRLVYDNRVPALMSLIFMAAVLILPILYWGKIWALFAEF